MPRIRKDPIERRNEILKNALALFESRGYRQVSIEDIAQTCKIARTTIYEYFPNKEQVLFALVERISDSMTIGDISGSSCKERLENLAAQYLHAVQKNRSLYLLLFREAPAMSDDFSAKLLKWRSRPFEQVVRIADEGIQLGELHPTMSKQDVAFLFQAIIGQRAGELLMIKQEVDAQEEAERLVQLLWYGIGADLRQDR